MICFCDFYESFIQTIVYLMHIFWFFYSAEFQTIPKVKTDIGREAEPLFRYVYRHSGQFGPWSVNINPNYKVRNRISQTH